MKSRTAAAIIPVLIIAVALEFMFVPIVPVLASPPNTPLPTTCTQVTSAKVTGPYCTFTASYYRGMGSLAYCFVGEGGLYLKGGYYFTRPETSSARQVGNAFCPAMRS